VFDTGSLSEVLQSWWYLSRDNSKRFLFFFVEEGQFGESSSQSFSNEVACVYSFCFADFAE